MREQSRKQNVVVFFFQNLLRLSKLEDNSCYLVAGFEDKTVLS